MILRVGAFQWNGSTCTLSLTWGVRPLKCQNCRFCTQCQEKELHSGVCLFYKYIYLSALPPSVDLTLSADGCMCTSPCFRTYFPTSLQNISLLQQKKPINCSVRTEFNCCPPYSPCLSAFLAALQLIWYNNAPQNRLRTFFRWQKIINDATCTAECQHQLDLFIKY